MVFEPDIVEVGDEFEAAGDAPAFRVDEGIFNIFVATRLVKQFLVEAKKAWGDALDEINDFGTLRNIVVALLPKAQAFEPG